MTEQREADRLRDVIRANLSDGRMLGSLVEQLQQLSELEDLLPIVQAGIYLRDAGRFDESDRLYAHALHVDPQCPFAYYERAISLLLRGRHVDALVSVERLVELRPDDYRGAMLAARLLQSIGDYDRAAVMLCIAAREYMDDAVIYAEFGAFLKRYPCSVGTLLSARFEAHPRFLNTGGVLAQVRAALAEKRGFAMIRLGDGEGAFMRMSEEEEQRGFSHLYARNRADRANVWFAGEIDLAESGFLKQALKLRDLVREVDIIGVPYRSWVEHEYRLLSVVSVSTLVNALRVVDDIAGEQQFFCRQDVHAHMKDIGELAKLVREQDEIGLISCHPGLPARLKDVMGVHDVEFHKLPGEKLFRAHLGEEAVSGVHFPDIFNRVMTALDRPLNGKLFLVAGGILGKFYCGRIKASGGVALDVGSVVDAWVGAATRPGITAESAI
jgi:hypothetical protein